jgi:predicted small secreted protein
MMHIWKEIIPTTVGKIFFILSVKHMSRQMMKLLSALFLIFAVVLSGCTTTQPDASTGKDIQPTGEKIQASQPGNGQGPQIPFPDRPGGNIRDTIGNLTSRGYDLTPVKTALDKGDNQTARQLLSRFYDQHPEARPHMPLERMKALVQNLTARGLDTREIQAALDTGDGTKADTLLNRFLEAHPEARPTFSMDPSQMRGMIDRLKQQGVDVTELQKAYDSGDMNSTRELIRQTFGQRSRD